MAEARNKADDIDDINRRIGSRNTRPATISDSHLEILGKKGFAHLASLGPDGEPQSHPVWFDFDAAHGRLLVSTGTDRQKYRNIQRDP
ncbi:pyridoxamine 5'-phosphate oxidase family protein, partial [Nocardia farcinica]